MKWFFLSCLILSSCGDNYLSHLSKDQLGLFTLSESFTKDYKHLNDSIAREKLIGEYKIKVQDYLMRSCDSSLESMRVQMTKIEEDDSGKLWVEFTDNTCKYFFHQAYSTASEMKTDVVYRFIKSLKKNTDLTLRFLYAGNVGINNPENISDKSFEIEVIPIALVKDI